MGRASPVGRVNSLNEVLIMATADIPKMIFQSKTDLVRL